MSVDMFIPICEMLNEIKKGNEVELPMILENYNVVVTSLIDEVWKPESYNLDRIEITGKNGLYKIKLLEEKLVIVLSSIVFHRKFGNILVKFDVLKSTKNIKKIAFFQYVGVLIPKDAIFEF